MFLMAGGFSFSLYFRVIWHCNANSFFFQLQSGSLQTQNQGKHVNYSLSSLYKWEIWCTPFDNLGQNTAFSMGEDEVMRDLKHLKWKFSIWKFVYLLYYGKWVKYIQYIFGTIANNLRAALVRLVCRSVWKGAIPAKQFLP